MTRKEILDRLIAVGFEKKTTGLGDTDREPSDGMRHPREKARGSLYVATDFLVANGPYRSLEKLVKPTTRDWHDCPVWKGAIDVAQALKEIEAKYGAGGR